MLETKEIVTPTECSSCGDDLTDAKVTGSERRVTIDIIYEVVNHTVIAQAKPCSGCGHSNKSEFPDGMDGKLQYCNGIKVMIVNFLMVQMISLERVQEYFNGIIGRLISQAIMLKYLVSSNYAEVSCPDK
jgi:hypothetical protein